MTDPQRQSETQLANITAATGMTLDDFSAAVRRAGLDRHGAIVAYLKSDHGLTHGNANLIAHRVLETLTGGPRPADALLAGQYAGAKSALLPLYEHLAAIAEGQGDDVEKVVQKTGVSFRRRKRFALVQAPSAKRVTLGLDLPETPIDARVAEDGGMCSHRVTIVSIGQIDDDVQAWIRISYEAAG